MKSDINIYKPSAISKEWLILDAKDMVLGRFASRVALILKGKHKPSYAPNMDCGDNIIIVNADKIYLSGKKLDKKVGKVYYRHTGYPGGLKSDTAFSIFNGPRPEKLLEFAITRMLKKSPLRNKILGNLHIYKGQEHPHAAQQPKPYDLSLVNQKNKKRN